jgi:hypothetical protein
VDYEDTLVGVAKYLPDESIDPEDPVARHMLLAAHRSEKPCVATGAQLPLLPQ